MKMKRQEDIKLYNNSRNVFRIVVYNSGEGYITSVEPFASLVKEQLARKFGLPYGIE